MAHTTGPWQVGGLTGRGDDNDERIIELYDGGPVIGAAWMMGEDFGTTEAPEREANARLMAAAPELLIACKAALRSLKAINEQLEGLDLPLDDIEAAIAKATTAITVMPAGPKTSAWVTEQLMKTAKDK